MSESASTKNVGVSVAKELMFRQKGRGSGEEGRFRILGATIEDALGVKPDDNQGPLGARPQVELKYG